MNDNIDMDENKDFPDSAPKNFTPGQIKKVIIIVLTLLTGIGAFTAIPKGHKKVAAHSINSVEASPVKDTGVEQYEAAIAAQKVNAKLTPGLNAQDKLQNDVSPGSESNLEQENDPSQQPQMGKNQNKSNYSQSSMNSEPVNYRSTGSSGYSAKGAGAAYHMGSEMQMRLDGTYQAMVTHFNMTKEKAWMLSGETVDKMKSNGSAISGVEAPLVNLYEGAENHGDIQYQIASGTRILAVSEAPVNSDHPGYFTSKIIRPSILVGAKLICQSGAQSFNRIQVQPNKIVIKDVDYQLHAQIEMLYAGLSGSVTNHWMKRIIPTVVNATIAAGFVAWSSKNENSTRIDTRDAITQSVVESTLPGVQQEVSRLGGDYPNTVETPEGTQFSVLLVEPLKFKM